MICSVRIFTGIMKPLEIIVNSFVSVSVFSACFNAVGNNRLDPTYMLFKWPYA